MSNSISYRSPGPDRPELATPPQPMPLLQGRRLRKQWRYVGVYAEELMLCVGLAHVGPIPQAFWAVWDRERRQLVERTRSGRGGVRMEPGHVSVVEREARIDLHFEERPGVEIFTPAGESYIWTRKQAPVELTGIVYLPGRTVELAGPIGFVDDSAGYHDRETSWWWSAGLGTLDDGRAAAWNLVQGIHDAPERSERTVWIDGEPREVEPVAFADDLGSVRFADGAELCFDAEAVRERDDNFGLVRSEYRQPFGTFAGSLGDGLMLREGRGVMERHNARW
jgi:hypothetical protein